MTCRHFFTLPWDPRATDGSKWPEGGGLIVKLAKNEYIIAGNGIVVVFQSKTEKRKLKKRNLVRTDLLTMVEMKQRNKPQLSKESVSVSDMLTKLK